MTTAVLAPPTSPDAGSVTFNCAYCGKRFKREGWLRLHVGAAHPKAPTPAPEDEVLSGDIENAVMTAGQAIQAIQRLPERGQRLAKAWLNLILQPENGNGTKVVTKMTRAPAH